MRWAHLITPMCQILNVVITSCVSFVLVYIVFFVFFSFFFKITSWVVIVVFRVVVLIVCGQMK